MINNTWIEATTTIKEFDKKYNKTNRGISRGTEGYTEFFATTAWDSNHMYHIKINRNMMDNSTATITLKMNDNGPVKNEKEFSLPTTTQGINETLKGMMKMFF